MKRTELRRTRYRTLRSDEPDPPGEPLQYNATDGRVILRWKIAPASYVERPLREDDGTFTRWKPRVSRHQVDVAEAVTRYEGGESLPRIAAALGADSGHLSRLLRAAGVQMRTPSAYATPLDPAVVIARYTGGEGHQSIARDLGVGEARVRSILRTAGVRLRGAGRLKGRGSSGGAVTYETEFQAAKPLVRERSRGRCEAAASPNCSGQGGHVHHRRLRSQGGTNELDNLLDVCVWCHSFIHGNPALSYERGWLVRG